MNHDSFRRRAVAWMAGAGTLLALLAIRPGALAQGCVCVRQVGPTSPLQGILEEGKFQVGVGYRWLHSDRHFTGDQEDTQRQAEHSEVINNVHYLDLTATYAITKRFNTTLILPFQIADRSQVVRSND